ncbi:transglycosylase family protein [Candidatus Roizmanbacteria bacterium]|nr:transglycosylase family protein [Candidatus Roizmanbacteria bacterium]
MYIALESSRKKIPLGLILLISSLILATVLFILNRKKPINTQVLSPQIITPSPTLIPTATLTPIPTDTPTPSLTPFPTPTPQPTATPTPWPVTEFESYFSEYSAKYQVSIDLLKKIAHCESGISPGAVNGPYGGMFQFTVETWQATRRQMGADPNPDLRFGAKEAIETAAYKIANKGERAWANCL